MIDNTYISRFVHLLSLSIFDVGVQVQVVDLEYKFITFSTKYKVILLVVDLSNQLVYVIVKLIPQYLQSYFYQLYLWTHPNSEYTADNYRSFSELPQIF